MKNFLKRKAKSSNKAGAEASSARITNETVAEHREQVLAGGRKFKYPLQYQKHKLVINTLVIGIAAVILLVVLCWQQLYVAQNSSKLMYRVTQILPVSVASVDGEPVRYSSYLMRYRSSIYFAEKQDSLNLSSVDGKRQAAYIQRRELDRAEEDAYVTKIARERKLTVSSEEVDTFIKKDLSAHSVSMNAYEKTVLNSYYDWSLDEYKSIVSSELLKRKVSFAVDDSARSKAEDLLKSVSGGADFATVAAASSEDDSTKQSGGDAGDVAVSSLDTNGLVESAKHLEVGQVSGLIQGVDSYYFIKLVSKNDSSVHYRVIGVKLSAFAKQFQDLQKQGKIKEFISVAKQ